VLKNNDRFLEFFILDTTGEICGLEAGFVDHNPESGLHKDVEYFD
jgi:hypothetical protein